MKRLSIAFLTLVLAAGFLAGCCCDDPCAPDPCGAPAAAPADDAGANCGGGKG